MRSYINSKGVINLIVREMDKELMLKKESENDGQSIFLFYDEFYSLYVAFGLSAYYSTMVVDPFLTYSDTLDLPIALFTKGYIRLLGQSLKKIEHTPGSIYLFRTKTPIGKSGYDKWKNEVKERHESII